MFLTIEYGVVDFFWHFITIREIFKSECLIHFDSTTPSACRFAPACHPIPIISLRSISGSNTCPGGELNIILKTRHIQSEATFSSPLSILLSAQHLHCAQETYSILASLHRDRSISFDGAICFPRVFLELYHILNHPNPFRLQ